MINFNFFISVLILLIIIIILLIERVLKLKNNINFLIGAIPDIIWKMNTSYIITFISPADEKIRGFKKNEVVGQSIFKHLTENSKSIVEMMREIRLDEQNRGIYPEIKSTEVELIRKNNTPILMEVIIRYEYKNKKIIGFSGVARDITLRKQNEEELFFKANYDPLTKLNNRRSFLDIANREFDMAKRYGKPLSLIMFDIDFFKRVNDTYGHDVGDIVLKKVAEIGSQNLRTTDVFARFGGEEFVILTTETELEGAIKLAEKLRKTFEKEIIVLGSQKIKFTISLGVTSQIPKDKNIEAIIKRADKFLYKAKELGRNKTIFY